MVIMPRIILSAPWISKGWWEKDGEVLSFPPTRMIKLLVTEENQNNWWLDIINQVVRPNVVRSAWVSWVLLGVSHVLDAGLLSWLADQLDKFACDYRGPIEAPSRTGKEGGSFQNQAAQTRFNSMEIIQIIQEQRKMSLWSCFNNLRNAANMSLTLN